MRHALEGADFVGAVEEDVDTLAIDAAEHLARVALAAGPGGAGCGACPPGCARCWGSAAPRVRGPWHPCVATGRRLPSGAEEGEETAAICVGQRGKGESFRFALDGERGKRDLGSGMPRNRGIRIGIRGKMAEAGRKLPGECRLQAPRQVPALNTQWTRGGCWKEGCGFLQVLFPNYYRYF